MNSKPSPSLTRAFGQAAEELRRLQLPKEGTPPDAFATAMSIAARRIRESAQDR